MSDARRGLGQLGERMAAEHLTGLGYEILECNWRSGLAGEADLVVRDGDCLVIVEVRTRRGKAFGTPEESVSLRKQARLARLAQAYAMENDWAGPLRIDVVGVHLSEDGRLLRINHVVNAVGG